MKKLRSRLNPTSAEANLVSVSVGKYTYKIDLLTLLVYDEENTKYNIGDILTLALENKIKLDELDKEYNTFKENQEKSNKSMVKTMNACMEYTKTLQDKIITLDKEIANLKAKE